MISRVSDIALDNCTTTLTNGITHFSRMQYNCDVVITSTTCTAIHIQPAHDGFGACLWTLALNELDTAAEFWILYDYTSS
jgi:hypothetical protein